MPITVPQALEPITQREFAKLDYQVMRQAFESQNTLGRLCEEEIYQNDLFNRLSSAGLSPQKEVPIVVSHRSFTKTYLIDLIVANAGVYELKTAQTLTGAHEAQLLNYLFLTNIHHGKLINFRSPQIESRFVNTTLTPEDRRHFSTDFSKWQEAAPSDVSFRQNLLSLLQDWGCRLNLSLYNEAMIQLSGGADQVVQRLPLFRENTALGSQWFNLLTPDTGFRITALAEGTSEHEHHLRTLLRLSSLGTLQWVNLDRQAVRFVTLSRS